MEIHSFNEAAALHRGKRIDELADHRGEQASMRPRLFTAENPDRADRRAERTAGFNEAAALHRGKQDLLNIEMPTDAASMRPRLFTAENRTARKWASASRRLQ